MPRYEIVAHLTCELDGGTAEEAATAFRQRVLAEPERADDLLHLAVWRADPEPTASPLPASLRQQLLDFFTALERSAGEAEETFRQQVAAILMSSPATNGGADIGALTEKPEGVLPPARARTRP